ncbi:MAG: hypothetical protein U0R23_06055 [Candidatus Nanopelagicales bacterium]
MKAWFVAGALLVATVAPAHAAVPVQLPPGSIKHQNSQFWSWFGPANWTSADSAYGITITSGNGRLSLDYGSSSVICSAGDSAEASARQHFAEQRQALRQNLRQAWRRSAMRRSAIRQLPEAQYGPLYFRQSLTISGRSDGRGYGGEVVLDYSLASGPTYCFSRKQSRIAPAAGLNRSLRQLRSVQASIAYFGPGV